MDFALDPSDNMEYGRPCFGTTILSIFIKTTNGEPSKFTRTEESLVSTSPLTLDTIRKTNSDGTVSQGTNQFTWSGKRILRPQCYSAIFCVSWLFLPNQPQASKNLDLYY